jgi:hypothetical protein
VPVRQTERGSNRHQGGDGNQRVIVDFALGMSARFWGKISSSSPFWPDEDRL